jgi:hypothetical protein
MCGEGSEGRRVCKYCRLSRTRQTRTSSTRRWKSSLQIEFSFPSMSRFRLFSEVNHRFSKRQFGDNMLWFYESIAFLFCGLWSCERAQAVTSPLWFRRASKYVIDLMQTRRRSLTSLNSLPLLMCFLPAGVYYQERLEAIHLPMATCKSGCQGSSILVPRYVQTNFNFQFFVRASSQSSLVDHSSNTPVLT